MTKGKFITLEGADGSGKSTQAAFLVEQLNNFNIDALLTREPGGSPGAEDIRTLLVEGETQRWSPLSEALLHYAARLEHLNNTILPALEAGRWVISDRFSDSTMAYQGYGHQLGCKVIESLHQIVVGDLTPDLTIIFDIAAQTGLKRAVSISGVENRYERMNVEFHSRLCAGFLEIAKYEPKRCVVIDASGEIDDIKREVIDLVRQRFELDVS